MYRLLSSIPLDHLAANGESMVGLLSIINSHAMVIDLSYMLSVARKGPANHPGPLEPLPNARSVERRSQVVLEHVQHDPVRSSESRISNL